MARLINKDRGAMALGLLAPLATALVLLPFRADWSNTNVALVLVAVIVAVATLGNRIAGVLAAALPPGTFDPAAMKPAAVRLTTLI